ncbi:MAG: Holliday junction resolvase RuvX [Flavobacteriaceae bacterium]
MGRILALDYGRKRTGIAVTDELQMIASGLTTVATHKLMDFLGEYMERENVTAIVVGAPRQMDNSVSEAEAFIQPFLKKFAKAFPHLPVHRQDERFTSKMAQRSLLAGGVKKKKRQDKALLDEVSATLILQSYLNRTL